MKNLILILSIFAFSVVSATAQNDPDFDRTWVPKHSKHHFSNQVAFTDSVKLLPGASLLIGDTVKAEGSAVVEIESSSQGVLLPRMTGTQRDAIVEPANGLIVYNTTTNKLNFYNGSVWVVFAVD